MRLRTLVRVLIVLAMAPKVEAQSAIAFTNIAVVDVQGGVLRPDQTVVIAGNRIAASDDAGRVHLPRGVRIIRGKGKFLMPGLWDMHVHEMPTPHAAGLPVSAVLRIATLAPAQFFGRESELGTVTRGKLADLILLDADPLQSIGNTRLVRAVVADGRLYHRAALDELFSDAGTESVKH